MSKQIEINGIQWPCMVPDNVFVGDPSSVIGVCTLWYPLDKFCKRMPGEVLSKICIAGQLRDPSGLNYMVRNILANPRIKFLVVCGHDAVLESKTITKDRVSTKNLLELLFDKKSVVLSEYIENVIPAEDITELVSNVSLINLYKVDWSVVVDELIKLCAVEKNGLWSVPKLYPQQTFSRQQIPSLRSSTIVADTVVDGYVMLLKNLLNYAEFQKRRKYPEGTLSGFSVKVVIKTEDPDNLFFDENHLPPGCNKEYLERQYFPQVVGCKIPDGEEYSYGSLLQGQVQYMIAALTEDSNSKDAVAALWKSELHHGYKNPPCFVFAQALILDNKLYFICNMRSHNIIKCWAENAFAFRKLQGEILKSLKEVYPYLELGDLVVHSISAQFNLNSQQLKIAQAILEDRQDSNGKALGYKSIRRKYFARDVVNSYITLEGKDIVLYLRSRGKIFRKYRAQTARSMKDILHLDGLDFISDHAMYIGITLAEAEIALRLGIPFEQDKKLVLSIGLKIDKARGIAVAVDFDKVIHKYSNGWRDGSIYDEPQDGAKEGMQELKDMGFFTIIYSTRGNEPEQRNKMKSYLEEHQILFNEIAIGGKPYARYYIDDKAVRFVTWRDAISCIYELEERREK